jgi:HD-GYP domain-containing protein (c-di-GMP phosphodiesterase class II)
MEESMLNEKQKINQIISLSQEIATVNDIDILLEHILTVACQFTNADAGSIYIMEGNYLKFSHTLNNTLQKRLQPGQKLIYSTFTTPVDNESICGYVAGTDEMLNIPDVYELGDNVTYAFNKSYDGISQYRTKSMLTFPMNNLRGEVIGVLQLINSMSEDGNIVPFSKDDEQYILHFSNNAAIAIERAKLTRDIILRMISMAELRDPKETGAHVNRVAGYAVEIYEVWASRRGVSAAEIAKNKDILRIAAMLHDVGKVAISDVILKKPAHLDPAEYEIMKSHTYLGARLFAVSHSDLDHASAQVALCHHERWDGKGYPGYINVMTGQCLPGYETGDGKAIGRKGEEIPPFGRLVAIADVYDALSSQRVYKEPWAQEQVLDELMKERGKHFDPEMIDAFFIALDSITEVGKRYV